MSSLLGGLAGLGGPTEFPEYAMDVGGGPLPDGTVALEINETVYILNAKDARFIAEKLDEYATEAIMQGDGYDPSVKAEEADTDGGEDIQFD